MLKSKHSFAAIAMGAMFVASAVAEARMETRAGSKTDIVAPFGFPGNQPPPPGSVINLADFEVGFSAQQVCGYTDWSTLQLRLPRKLLSKEYWKNVGTGLRDEAVKMAMNLTGAIPSMLACNVSPTYCHVFNQAEMMAAFEGDLSFKTCAMLDGVSNVSQTQAEGLRNCMASQLKRSPSLTSSEARERCLTTGNDADLSRDAKIARTAGQQDASDSFSMSKFINDAFPDNVQQTGGGTYSLTNGSYKYSRLNQSKSFMQGIFPGVELSGTGSVVRGGTFNPAVDTAVAGRKTKTSDKIMEILAAMKSLQNKGMAPAQIIQESQKLWADKGQWKAGEVPAIYRPSADGSEPTLLVTPEQLVMLLALAKPGEADVKKALDTSELRQVVERLSVATAQVQVNDMLADVYTRTLDECTRNPSYQRAVAQENCKSVLERTKGEMEILAYKRDAERQARTVQVEIADIVRGVQARRGSEMKAIGSDIPEAASAPIRLPGQL